MLVMHMRKIVNVVCSLLVGLVCLSMYFICFVLPVGVSEVEVLDIHVSVASGGYIDLEDDVITTGKSTGRFIATKVRLLPGII